MFIIITILVLGLLFYASYSISAGIYLNSLCRNRDSADSVAITFDDGVDPVITPKVLDVLKNNNAKATFFVIGEKVLQYPDIVKRIVSEGHAIGNHSYRHEWYFPMKSTSAIYDEIKKCNDALRIASGAEIMIFRPPFGVTNPMVACAVRKYGLISVGWSIRSLDTVGRRINAVAQRVNSRIKAGEVILLHDNRLDADMLLENILGAIRSKGLRPVTVYELFNIG